MSSLRGLQHRVAAFCFYLWPQHQSQRLNPNSIWRPNSQSAGDGRKTVVIVGGCTMIFSLLPVLCETIRRQSPGGPSRDYSRISLRDGAEAFAWLMSAEVGEIPPKSASEENMATWRRNPSRPASHFTTLSLAECVSMLHFARAILSLSLIRNRPQPPPLLVLARDQILSAPIQLSDLAPHIPEDNEIVFSSAE